MTQQLIHIHEEDKKMEMVAKPIKLDFVRKKNKQPTKILNLADQGV